MKGQVFSADLILAMGVFLILLGFCFLIWNGMVSSADLNVNREKSYEKTYQILDTFVRSPGIPSNWNEDNKPSTIGLAKNDRMLDDEKVIDMLFDIDEGNITEALDIQGFNYSLYILSSVNEAKVISKWERIADYYRLDPPDPLDTEPCCGTSYNPTPCTGTDISLCRYITTEITDAEFTLYDPADSGQDQSLTELNNLLDDLHEYDAIVFEDTDLRQSDFGGRENELIEWVEDGGSIVVTGDCPFVSDLFGISEAGRGDAVGEIVHLGNPQILMDVEVGWCYEANYKGSKLDEGSCSLPGDSSPGTCHDFIGLIQRASDEYYALQANYGDNGGMIYAMVSPYGDVYDSCGGNFIQSGYNIATRIFRSELRLSGAHPVNATEFATVAQRFAVLEGTPVLVEFYIWR